MQHIQFIVNTALVEMKPDFQEAHIRELDFCVLCGLAFQLLILPPEISSLYRKSFGSNGV